MKKIFTLAIATIITMGASAQDHVETNWDWQTVDGDGNINSVLSGADDTWQKEVNVSLDNFSIYMLNNANPDETTTPNLTSDNWDKYKEMKYATQHIYIETYDSEGNPTGGEFYAVCGTGVPAVKFIGGKKVKDGDPVTDEDGNEIWTVPMKASDGTTAGYVYYVPDGSMGAPTVGPFITLKANVAGEFKVGFWANKGGSRALYIIDRSTGKALNPLGDNPEYHAEGWVQGLRVLNLDSLSSDRSLIYLNPMPIDSSYVIQANPSEVGKYNNYNIGNNRKIGYLFFNAEAGKEYTIMGSNWQLGIQGVKFTTGTNGIRDINDPKKNFNVNAPIFNLAGQRVDKNYRGVVIQDGRKFIQ